MSTNDPQALQHVRTTEAMEVRGMPMATVLAGTANGLDAYVGECFRRCHERVARFLISLDDADASDLMSDVFMALPQKISGFRDLGAGLPDEELTRRFERWLVTVAHNLWRTKRRSIQRRAEVTFDAGADRPASRTSLSSSYAWGQELEHALQGMPAASREVWALHEAGYKPADIAAQLGLAPNAVSKRLSRAYEHLATAMRPGFGAR